MLEEAAGATTRFVLPRRPLHRAGQTEGDTQREAEWPSLNKPLHSQWGEDSGGEEVRGEWGGGHHQTELVVMVEERKRRSHSDILQLVKSNVFVFLGTREWLHFSEGYKYSLHTLPKLLPSPVRFKGVKIIFALLILFYQMLHLVQKPRLVFSLSLPPLQNRWPQLNRLSSPWMCLIIHVFNVTINTGNVHIYIDFYVY